MARLGGLGRGLDALIPAGADESPGTVPGATARDAQPGPRLIDLPIGAVSPNPNQPRVHFDEETLAELAASIREVGLLQPVLVREVEGGNYQLVAGERRWRAARRAGLLTIPAIVRITDDLSSVEQALVENLHRQDLTPLEEAAAFQQLIEDFGLTHEQVAGRVGKSRSAITNTLRLMSLPPSIQHLLADGRLSAGHARAILGSSERAFQEELAKRAVDENWSVRSVEEAIRQRHSNADRGSSTTSGLNSAASPRVQDGAGVSSLTRLRPPGLLELEHLLAEHLQTKVAVSTGSRRGKVTIEFADLEDLERIYRRIVVETSAVSTNPDHIERGELR